MNVPIQWPIGGVSDLRAYSNQPSGAGQAGTCVDARNVRSRDPTTGRYRGAQRSGHTRYINATVNSTNAVQCMGHVVGATGSSRTIYPFFVAGGNVYGVSAGAYSLASSGSGALSSSAQYIHWAEMDGVVYFADGANYKKWTAATNTVSAWAATDGTIPANGSNKPRLICVFRDRILLSGIVGDEQNIYASRQGDPTDFDYAEVDAGAAWATNTTNGPGGQSDIVTALFAFSDDTLIIGGDHTINKLSNDPSDGGRIDLISDTIGMAFGKAFCRDASGRIYFFETRGGIYSLVIDGGPELLSLGIAGRLDGIDLSTHKILMVWDDTEKAVMTYITHVSGSASVHYAFDPLTRAFWPDAFAAAGHNPTAVHVFDGDAPSDRVILLGCRDGYVRKIDAANEDDDDAAISSYVWLGPLQSGATAVRLRSLEFRLGSGSDPVTYTVHRGDSAEDAFGNAAHFTGTWTAARTYVENRKAIGDAVYVKVADATQDKAWQFEWATAEVELLGKSSSKRY